MTKPIMGMVGLYTFTLDSMTGKKKNNKTEVTKVQCLKCELKMIMQMANVFDEMTELGR